MSRAMTKSTRQLLLLQRASALPLSRLSYQQTRFSGSDYGSPGPGDPETKDTPNPSADKEHPGPPPPKAGQDTGSTGTKAGSEGHNTPSSAEQQQKRGYHTSSRLRFSATGRFHADAEKGDAGDSSSSSSSSSSKGGASPKILDHKASTDDKDVSEDVRKHNEEFEKRGDRAANRIGDDGKREEVSKEFWKEDKNSKRE